MFEPIKFKLKHPLTASTHACREEEAAAHEKHGTITFSSQQADSEDGVSR